MTSQIRVKVNLNKINSKSQVIAKKRRASFKSLPTEIKMMIVRNLSPKTKGNFRATSFAMKKLVDYQQWQEFDKLKQSSKDFKRLNIDHFTSNGFTPPILYHLISINNLIQANSFNQVLWYFKEKLLASFYEQARGHFEKASMKVLFTLTMLTAFKHLTTNKFSTFDCSKGCEMSLVSFSFNITNLFFGILWSVKSRDSFDFEHDGPNFLSMLSRMIEIKKALEIDPKTNVVNTLTSMDFKSKLVIVGSRVNFSRPLVVPSKLDCFITLEGRRVMIDSFSSFMFGSKFNFKATDSTLKVNCRFTSQEARKGEEIVCGSSFYDFNFLHFTAGCSREYFFKY